MTDLVKVLMKRDGLSHKDAEEIRHEMMMRVLDGENPEDVLEDEGLEPDYFFDIMPAPEIRKSYIYI